MRCAVSICQWRRCIRGSSLPLWMEHHNPMSIRVPVQVRVLAALAEHHYRMPRLLDQRTDTRSSTICLLFSAQNVEVLLTRLAELVVRQNVTTRPTAASYKLLYVGKRFDFVLRWLQIDWLGQHKLATFLATQTPPLVLPTFFMLSSALIPPLALASRFRFLLKICLKALITSIHLLPEIQSWCSHTSPPSHMTAIPRVPC